MNELEVRERIDQQADAYEPMEVVVAVKTSAGITVYEGLADSLEVEADNTFWADDRAYSPLKAGQSMSIHFYDSIRSRREDA